MDSLFFHPKVVHLPVALALLLPLVSGGLLLAWWRDWLPGRSWALVVVLQALLFGSGLVALQTGEAEEERVEEVVPEPALEAHEEAAESFVWASGGVLAVMLLGFGKRRKRALAAATAATVGTLLVLALGYRTGEAGGELVYRHGAARAYTGASAAGGDVRGRSLEGDHDHEGDDDDDD